MPKRRQPGAGRKPTPETVRLTVSNDPVRWGALEISLSEDLALRLLQMRDGMQASLDDPMVRETLRVEWVSLEDAGMPGVLIRAEPLTFTPRGNRLRKAKRGRIWITQIQARRLGVHPGIKSQKLEWIDAVNMRGIILMFHPEDFLATMSNPPKTPAERDRIYLDDLPHRG